MPLPPTRNGTNSSSKSCHESDPAAKRVKVTAPRSDSCRKLRPGSHCAVERTTARSAATTRPIPATLMFRPVRHARQQMARKYVTTMKAMLDAARGSPASTTSPPHPPKRATQRRASRGSGEVASSWTASSIQGVKLIPITSPRCTAWPHMNPV